MYARCDDHEVTTLFVARGTEFWEPGHSQMSAPYLLVIDDDSDICAILQLAMSFEGIPVVTAEDGLVALEKLQAQDLPFLILLDLMMPRMDGWEFSEKLATDPRLKDIPVVVMTAFEGTSRPFPPSLEILRKPMSLETTRNIVRKYYGQADSKS